MKVAIIGTAPSTFNEAPFDSDWEIWGLAQYRTAYPVMPSLLFEIHASGTLTGPDEDYFTEDYLEFLNNHYVVGWNPKFPYAEVNKLRKLNSKEWHLQGTISYMIAYAILKGATEIGVWGVDLVDDEEYQGQKAFVEGWLCFAEGRGIKIYTPESSALFKCPYRYGLEAPTDFESINQSETVQFLEKTAQEHMFYSQQYKNHDGIALYLKACGEAYHNVGKMLQSVSQGYPVGSGININHDQIQGIMNVRTGKQTKATLEEETAN